jgi:CRISPR-associated endonuclease/helicase Cas3
VFEEMLGFENVLQHHSGVAYSNDEDSPEYRKLLATENWDAPVIVTSSVRFFESLFSNKPSACRKLHNIAGSVLIFDEAQMIPLPYLIPCIETIKELVINYRCSAVLATATQSSLNKYFEPLNLFEIIDSPNEMYDAFKRVKYDCTVGKVSDNELVALLKKYDQVLCIVNTRRRAQALAEKIDGAMHLSTTMYPLHRNEVLTEIRERLSNGKPCIIISTSLIEAGVDVDFPVVYREKAGLDSIIQAAGRCNRENKREIDDSIVYVFESEDKPHGTIAQNVCAYEHVARQFNEISSLEAVKCYFEQLRYIIGLEGLDKKSVVQAFNTGANEAFSLPFESVSKTFHLIEEDTVQIYVLTRAPELYLRLRKKDYSRKLFRELQKYAISIRKSDFVKLEHQFERLDEDILLLTTQDFYNKKIGIELSSNGGYGLFC